MPDIFVPLDTSHNTSYLTELYITGVINQFAVSYADRNRDKLMKYKSADDFINSFTITDDIMDEFTGYAALNKIPKNEKSLHKSGPVLKLQLKALIARGIWRNDVFYKILSSEDKTVKAALDAMK